MVSSVMGQTQSNLARDNIIVHNKIKYYPSMYSFTVAVVNGSYMFRLHKVAIIGLYTYQKYKKETVYLYKHEIMYLYKLPV